MNENEAREKIRALREKIRRNAVLYYEKDAPVLSDAAYDALFRELSALEERLKAYVLSEEMETDLARLKNVYAAEAASVCKAILTENLPGWRETALAQEEVWQVVQGELIPAVHSFLLHQIKRNQSEIIAGLDLTGRIEKAILEQKPQEVHELVNRISGEHLVLLQLLGFLLGGIAGLLLVFVK